MQYIENLKQIPCEGKFVDLKSLIKETELQKKRRYGD